MIPSLQNVYKFFLKDTHINSYIAIQRTGSLKHFHWETIGVWQVLPIEPVMTAEDLVGALRYTPWNIPEYSSALPSAACERCRSGASPVSISPR